MAGIAAAGLIISVVGGAAGIAFMFGRHDNRLSASDARLRKLESRMDLVEHGQNELEKAAVGLSAKMDTVMGAVAELKTGIGEINTFLITKLPDMIRPARGRPSAGAKG